MYLKSNRHDDSCASGERRTCSECRVANEVVMNESPESEEGSEDGVDDERVGARWEAKADLG